MNRPMIILLTALVMLIVSADAVAQNSKRGFAVNLGIGVSQIKDTDGTDKFDGNAFGYNLGAEYRFTPNFALGGNTWGLGTADDDFNGTNTEIEVKGAEVAMRFIAPVSDGFEFFALAGQAFYTADLEPGGNNGFGDDAVMLGLGMDIGSGKFAFRLAGKYYDGSRDEQGALLTAGFNLRF